MDEQMCTDCGTTPVHWLSGSKCRRCAEKGGEGYLFVRTVDVERLLEIIRMIGQPKNREQLVAILDMARPS